MTGLPEKSLISIDLLLALFQPTVTNLHKILLNSDIAC